MSVEFHGNGTSLSSHETPSYLLIMKLSMKLLSKLALATHFRNVAGIFFHFLVTLCFRFIIEGDNAHESRISCAIMTQQCFVSLAMKFNIYYFFYFFCEGKERLHYSDEEIQSSFSSSEIQVGACDLQTALCEVRLAKLASS